MRCVSLFSFQLNFSHFSLHFLPRLRVLFFSTTGLLILEKKWVSSRAPHRSIPHTLSILFFLSFLITVFFLRGEIEPSTRLRQGLPERIRVGTKLYLQSLGTSCLGRVSPTFFPFPLSPRRRKLSDCMS